MTATNRGAERSPSDFYPTPYNATYSLLRALPELEHLAGPEGRWLEPCIGSGAILYAAENYYTRTGITPPSWYGVDVNPLPPMVNPPRLLSFQLMDFLECDFPQSIDCIVTNPPFSLVQPMITKAQQLCDVVIMLLQPNFLGSQKRSEWWQGNEPDQILVLSERPFPDSTEYAWFVWGIPPREKAIRVLPPFTWHETKQMRLAI